MKKVVISDEANYTAAFERCCDDLIEVVPHHQFTDLAGLRILVTHTRPDVLLIRISPHRA